jgi:peroxiredoxin Q/BCP
MNTRLREGDKAPGFTATTYDGKKISLRQFQGSPVWLIFYRYPGCPLCNLHISALKRRYPDFSSGGLKIITIFESPNSKFDPEMKDVRAMPFPLIADPERVLYRAYGTEVKLSGVVRPSVGATFLKAIFSGYKQGNIDGKLGQMPAHFLIAEDGTVEQAYYGRNIADHIPFEVVEKFVESHREGLWQPNVIE